MDARAAIAMNMDTAKMVSMMYVEDLSDEELMHRPDPGCNHIKWQVGHLIASEHMMVDGIAPGAMPALPDGFTDRYSKETAKSDDPDAFDSKEVLLKAAEEQRAATLATLAKMSDEQLDAASPEAFKDYAPTVGAVFSLQGGHWMMHAGQWAVARRQLGRAPLF